MKNYQTPLYKDENLLNKFLSRWSLSNVKKMTLEEYTDVNNKLTFTQWVESKTKHWEVTRE